MRRIVVTGALGYIGSRLIRDLPEAFPDAEILMLDNFATQQYGSLFELPPRGRYRFCEADVLDAPLTSIYAAADVVVHLAAIPPGGSDTADQMERVNVVGTERVAQACAETGALLVFPSTTSIYSPQSATVDEDCPPSDLQPQSPYAASKLRAEQLLTALGRSRDLRFITCRFGTVFGISPGMRFHTAVNKFVWQACMGIPLTVWRTALHQRRPYLDLEDAIRALLFIARGQAEQNETYNVLTTNGTVAENIECIRRHVPDVQVDYVDSPIMNQLSYTVSSEKFKELGFAFAGSLPGGIAATIELLLDSNRELHDFVPILTEKSA
jgi:UDP-glucose 4-epimerase